MARIENLHEFKLRTEWFSKDSLHFNEGRFMTNGSLKDKVDEEGRLKPFGGNTIIFWLDEDCRERLADIQAQLYTCCGHLLAVPLHPSEFHMTLHDLKSGAPGPELTTQVEKSGKAVMPLLEGIKQNGIARIKMRAEYLFNMMNTSVVVGLSPVDEENCDRLMSLYELFQGIDMVRLPYQLTPHITMAYYRPGVYTEKELAGLKTAIRDVNRELRQLKPLEIELSTEQLEYQRFTDMNHYF
ncbi:MAG: hypothetical protein IJZ85_13900 [Lachnospiraceae bacterium]|nr:hypothetical protein [Lachnospiraceae bacterium]